MRLVISSGLSPGAYSTGGPTLIVIGVWRRASLRGCPLVHNRWVPQMLTGTIGTPVASAIRAAPDLSSLTSKDWLIVASGKTPTTSPALSAANASSKAPAPALRSTGMWCMPRISGPLSLWSKTAFFAMNRTSRRDGRAASPTKMKSR